MRSSLAHIVNEGAGGVTLWLVVVVAALVLLVVENHFVAGRRAFAGRRSKAAVGVALILALSAVVLPAGRAQTAGPLPDLISDPPRPSFFKEITTVDGSTRLVVTFDGYVHNVGEGALDVVGNPQLPDGMQQRVRTGDGWENVAAPTVRFETDDGHNHFHLIEAVEYVLWNELQGSQTAIGSKVGFCLVDSEQMEPGNEQAYSEELDNFCEEDNPGATDLRMGISSGWRDTYDSTTTLQWVDVSDVTPGRYWIGAITDPNDEIVESSEENNGLIFSDRTIEVPGFAPRPQPAVIAESASTSITLGSTAYGDVSRPIFVIEAGPQSGTLNVPVGAELDSPSLTYFAEPGFEGSDQIVYSVLDANSPYPVLAPRETIDIDVRADAGTDATAIAGDELPPSLTAPSTFFETTAGDRFELSVDMVSAGSAPPRLFARGLPKGLVVDSSKGTVAGVAVEAGIFDVELIAVGANPALATVQNVTWIVNAAADAGGLAQAVDRSSPRNVVTQLRLGTNGLGLSFEATGLPPGLEIDDNAPVVTGTPTMVGSYEVTVRQVESSEVIAETSFTWTIRPSVAIDFVL